MKKIKLSHNKEPNKNAHQKQYYLLILMETFREVYIADDKMMELKTIFRITNVFYVYLTL